MPKRTRLKQQQRQNQPIHRWSKTCWLARWCNEPFFKAAVLECFVRLFIGEDDNGEKVYRLCEIVDVNIGQITYKFPVANKNEKPVMTNKT